MHDYDVHSAVYLLRQYGFMTDAESHQCEQEVEFIHGKWLSYCNIFIEFLQKVYVGMLVCDCMASCVKVNVW